jgi:hypothetical protein
VKRPVSVVLLSLLAILLTTGTASADVSGGGANNVVNVVNDTGTILRGHGAIAVFGGDSSQSSNVASALSQNCTGCHSRAVAVQELVVTGDPSDFRPTNAASAVNAACTGCTTVAYAYQNVIQSTPGATLSAATRQQATGLVLRIQAVAADPSVSDIPYCAPDCVPGVSDLSSPLTDTLDALTAQLDQVVQNGLVRNGSGVLDTEAHRLAPTAVG